MRIYKILARADWEAAEAAGTYGGSGVDRHDGYIHFSTAAQVDETARKYFSGLPDLLVLEVEGDELGAALKWEPSRGGQLFPHLYAELPAERVRRVIEAPLGADGAPQIDL